MNEVSQWFPLFFPFRESDHGTCVIYQPLLIRINTPVTPDPSRRDRSSFSSSWSVIDRLEHDFDNGVSVS